MARLARNRVSRESPKAVVAVVLRYDIRPLFQNVLTYQITYLPSFRYISMRGDYNSIDPNSIWARACPSL